MVNAEGSPRRLAVASVEASTANLDSFPADYSDAFAVAVVPGPRAADWARRSLRGADVANGAFRNIVWHGALGFDLVASGAPGTLFGWRISTDLPEQFVLDADGRLMRGRMVFDISATLVTWTTMLAFHRSAAARIWAVAGHVHRRLAPRLLGDAATALQRQYALGQS